MTYITKTNYAKSDSNSLRTTIPKEIVDKLGLSQGDNLIWILNEDKKSVCVKNVFGMFASKQFKNYIPTQKYFFLFLFL